MGRPDSSHVTFHTELSTIHSQHISHGESHPFITPHTSASITRLSTNMSAPRFISEGRTCNTSITPTLNVQFATIRSARTPILTISQKRHTIFFFFFNNPATPKFYPLPQHRALPV